MKPVVGKLIEQIIEEKKRELPPQYNEVVESIAIAIAEALDREFKESREFFMSELEKIRKAVDNVHDEIELFRIMSQPMHWYHVLWVVSELTAYIDKLGFRVSATVDPEGTYTYNLDLTTTQYTCVCPVYVCASSLGPTYSSLTILVNEKPVDVKLPDWVDIYVSQNFPVPTEVAFLPQGNLYTYAPKRKAKVTFGNSHTTESNEMTCFADYLRMVKEKGEQLLMSCYIPFRDCILKEIVGWK